MKCILVHKTIKNLLSNSTAEETDKCYAQLK